MDLANDTALITGSSGGIGEEFAHQLAQRRANLVLVARRLDKLEELRTTLLARHPDIEVDVIAADLSEPGSGRSWPTTSAASAVASTFSSTTRASGCTATSSIRIPNATPRRSS
jgi:short-subunit dehydrogenase